MFHRYASRLRRIELSLVLANGLQDEGVSDHTLRDYIRLPLDDIAEPLLQIGQVPGVARFSLHRGLELNEKVHVTSFSIEVVPRGRPKDRQPAHMVGAA